ncbi:PREDICTED: probable proteasome inhibitor [Camelina sativa]|uniref:Probable proteasome inhibitor n=1 Tax=Camelina sativa TaxID=90675 RepID=A0ABM0XP30_CAMSA|nr:PREDICTED: probable proteasome inhibitor [Camelina sativa]
MATPHAVMGVIRSVMPGFRNNYDKVAFVVHASFVISGFILTATGRPAFVHDALSSPTTKSLVGIEGWNEFDQEYAFVYKKPVKGSKTKVRKALVKCLVMNDKILVVVITEDGNEPAHLQIEVGNYTDESKEERDYDAQFKNLKKLVNDLKSEILFKLKHVSSATKSKSAKTNEEEPRDHVGMLDDPLGSTNDTTMFGVPLMLAQLAPSHLPPYLIQPQAGQGVAPLPYVPLVHPDYNTYWPPMYLDYY